MNTPEAKLLAAIVAKQKEDLMIGLKIGAKEVTDRLIEFLQSKKGVHMESLLTILGALAGFSCLVATEVITERVMPLAKIDPRALAA